MKKLFFFLLFLVIISSVYSLPDSFNWIEGENYNSPIRFQGSIGTCWAFSTVSTVEAAINLKYNTHLDIDLSEQDVICRAEGGSRGGVPADAFNYIKDNGILKEDCLSYTETDYLCEGGCMNPKRWYIEDFVPIPLDDETIKKNMIDHGPIHLWDSSFTPEHSIVLVGWENVGDRTRWIYKNSNKDRPEDTGYYKRFIGLPYRKDVYYVINPYSPDEDFEVKCTDIDGDNYCFWGLYFDMPDSCPSTCHLDADCDDINPRKSYWEDYNCLDIPIEDMVKSGCCVNPALGEPHFVLDNEDCCKKKMDYFDNSELGPTDKENCLDKWFFPSKHDSACNLISSSNFDNWEYIVQGCCCDWEDEPTKVHQLTFAECLHPDRKWFKFESIECSITGCDQKRTQSEETQEDLDLDGTPDFEDNCPQIQNDDQYDPDEDDIGSACDNCPDIWNYYQSDSDEDDVGNACDNCPEIKNRGQEDENDNNIGDACEVVHESTPAQKMVRTIGWIFAIAVIALSLLFGWPPIIVGLIISAILLVISYGIAYLVG